MNPCRSVLSRCTLSKPFRVIGLVLVLCVIAAGSRTGVTDSTRTQFTLKAIPASAVHHSWQAPHIRNKDGTSSNWSGYAVYTTPTSSGKKGKSKSAPTFSYVTGSWVVPSVVASASANTYSSTWVGLDGYSDGTVEQIGIEQDWSNGSPAYYAWYEMYPKWGYEIVGFPVNPRDTISASVEYTSNGAFKLTITNVTKNVTFSTTQRSPSAQRLSAEWIEEAPWSGGVLPLANFGKVDFSGCSATMNGHKGPIDDSAWTFDAITMATSDGTPKAVPSSVLTDKKGTPPTSSFSVTWKHE